VLRTALRGARTLVNILSVEVGHEGSQIGGELATVLEEYIKGRNKSGDLQGMEE